MTTIATGQFTIVDFNDVNISSTTPVSPVLDNLWLDTSFTPHRLKRWNGTVWVASTALTLLELDSAQNTKVNSSYTATTDMADDNKLTPDEKQAIKKEWDVIVAEKSILDAQATAYGVTTEKTTYGNNYTAISSYITPLLAGLTTTSTIVGTTFRTNFANYYSARTALLNKIANVTKTVADGAVTPTGLTTKLGENYVITGLISADKISGGTITGQAISGGTITGTTITVDGGDYFITDKGATTIATAIQNLCYDHAFYLPTLSTYNDPTYKDWETTAGNDNPLGEKWGAYQFCNPAVPVPLTKMYPKVCSFGNQTTPLVPMLFGLWSAVVRDTDYFRQGVNTAPAKIYTISAHHIRGIGATYRSNTSSNFRLRVKYYSVSGDNYTLLSTVTKDFTSTTAWQRGSFTITTPANCGWFDVHIASTSANWIYVDGVQIIEGSYPAKYDPEFSMWEHLASGNYGAYRHIDLEAQTLQGYIPSNFATSAQGTLATNALPKSGGTLTGSLTMTSPLYLQSGGSDGTGVRELNGWSNPAMYFKQVRCTSGADVIITVPAFAGLYYVVATCDDSATPCRAWFVSTVQVRVYLLGTATGDINVCVFGWV